ncbi:MFS transporter [Paraburkholderia acidisoli]|uniref:MFS transporter n=1 Tax=Paraburkholderia acidisoli TaxID=2571748 RepID=A0A7Z2GPM6_9BURK|nr:MFS transporter [Paraburkholderia acidisoli]QGZ65637.1 MFS transporter [Paraburkholderia acidisoli]
MAGWGEFKRGWRLILAATVGIGTGLTTMVFYTMGVFVPSLTKTFGWSDSQVMVAITIVLLGSSVVGPYVGALTDRIGARRVALGSVIGMGCAWALLALNTGSIAIFYATFTILTLCGAGTLPVTWTKSVIANFSERRGLALGICLIGTGLFGALIKLYAFYVMSAIGWRLAYVCIGAFVLCVTLPITFFFFREPRRALDTSAQAPGIAPEAGLGLREALRTRAFWILSASFFLLSLAISGIAPNLERFLTTSGFDLATAVRIAAWYGIGIVVGRLITGFCLDRMWAPGVVFLLMIPTMITFIVLAGGVSSVPVAMLMVFLVGSASGVEYDALAYLVSRYFGMRAYSAVYGSIFIGFAFGAGFGPVTFSKTFALTHSYHTLLFATAAVVLVGSGMLLTLGRYPRFDAARPGVAHPKAGSAWGVSSQENA